MSGLQYSLVRPAVVESSLTAMAPHMFWLMFRNVASDGLVFQDPEHAGVLSQPGWVLAAPSWENSATQGRVAKFIRVFYLVERGL
jgi:glucoamylase